MWYLTKIIRMPLRKLNGHYKGFYGAVGLLGLVGALLIFGLCWNYRMGHEVGPLWLDCLWQKYALVSLFVLIPPFVMWWWMHKACVTLQKEFDQKSKLTNHLKFDDITMLPNRNYFEYQLDTMVEQLKDQTLTVMYMEITNLVDLRNFAVSGERYHRRIKQVAMNVQLIIPEGALIGRLSEEAFALAYYSQNACAAIDELRARHAALNLNDSPKLHWRVGVANFDHSNIHVSASSLIHHATTAIFAGHLDIVTGLFYYHPCDAEKRNTELNLKIDLTDGIKHNELELFLQPQIDIKKNVVRGAEALLRWNHPVRGFLNPSEFVDLASNSALAILLGEWVINRALEIIVHHNNDLTISANIFPYHIQDRNFGARLGGLLQRNPKANPNKLKLEITEVGTIENYEVVSRNMYLSSKLGVGFSLDDFGTGYSSLNQLRTLPVNEIKIDRSFIDQLLVKNSDFKVVNSIISLASAFNLSVVAEGVETAEQLDELARLNCSIIQGFLFSKPLSLTDFDQWLANYKVESTTVPFA
jgi:EAL domain-containing protein (putative c-di-GMP-specific phosphodiesterase class I)/GGDEF domain-containing protein